MIQGIDALGAIAPVPSKVQENMCLDKNKEAEMLDAVHWGLVVI